MRSLVLNNWAQVVMAPNYRSQGPGFDSPWRRGYSAPLLFFLFFVFFFFSKLSNTYEGVSINN